MSNIRNEHSQFLYSYFIFVLKINRKLKLKTIRNFPSYMDHKWAMYLLFQPDIAMDHTRLTTSYDCSVAHNLGRNDTLSGFISV